MSSCGCPHAVKKFWPTIKVGPTYEWPHKSEVGPTDQWSALQVFEAGGERDADAFCGEVDPAIAILGAVPLKPGVIER